MANSSTQFIAANSRKLRSSSASSDMIIVAMPASESSNSDGEYDYNADSECTPPPPSGPKAQSAKDDNERHPAYALLLHSYLSTTKWAPLSDIYVNIKEKLSEMGHRTDSAAENSIRHNLSQNKAFEKVDPKKCNNERYVWRLRDEFRDVSNMKNTAHYRQESQRQRLRGNVRGKRRRSSTPKITFVHGRKNRTGLRSSKLVSRNVPPQAEPASPSTTVHAQPNPFLSRTPTGSGSGQSTPYYTPTEFSEFSPAENTQRDLPGLITPASDGHTDTFHPYTPSQYHLPRSPFSRPHTPSTPLQFMPAHAHAHAPASTPRSTPTPTPFANTPMLFASLGEPRFPTPNPVMPGLDGDGVELAAWMHVSGTPGPGTPASLCARCSSPTPPVSPFTTPAGPWQGRSGAPARRAMTVPVPVSMPMSVSRWAEGVAATPMSAPVYYAPRGGSPAEFVDPTLLYYDGREYGRGEENGVVESGIDPVLFVDDEGVEMGHLASFEYE